MRTCPSCGFENAADARFCSQCATALSEREAGSREERKVITVVFADLVGFTARAEDMDPEDVAALLAPYHARLKSELERYGGTVEKFIGDAVMALFGAPTAHEDDPERAVRAALAIRDFARDEEIELRIGVTTGEALISLEARPEHGETMATGDVINTAARLQTAAPVNGVLVGEATFRATRNAIEYESREPVEAKGKARPVSVWEALSPRARITLDRLHGASLVGRSNELALLEGALTRARYERSPQLVTLIGVPGIGKSRLVFELSQAVERDPELISWRQGRCLPYGDGVTFWALGEIVKAQAGILETDSALETEGKLKAAADDPWMQAHLRPLVGLAAEQEVGTDRRGEAFAAWRGFLELLAEERPLVVVIEDLHWADDTLLDFVDHLVEWAGGVPLLVVCTARPELLERRPGWGGGKPNALTLSLSPLSDDDTARLVGDLLERAVLPVETQRELLARAGGNPLYAEQFARVLEERGGLEEDWPLPETIQGLIAARLDLLPREEKALLQDAAALGKVFWAGALASLTGQEPAILEAQLHALERKQFVRRERQSAVAGENEYSFRHILVRDVAYGQIPRGERATKHRLAAEWIDSLGRPEDQAEMLAHHYLSALEYARATGAATEDLSERARVALREAGDRASGLNAFAAAARFYSSALELWPSGDSGRPSLLFAYGVARFNSEGGGADTVSEARDALLEAGDAALAAEAEILLGELEWNAAMRDRAFAHFERASELVAELPATRSKAFVLSQLSRFLMLAGAHAEAIRVGREALAMAEELGLDELQAHALNNIGSALVWSGDPAGITYLERGVAVSEAINSPEMIRAYGNLSTVLAQQGDMSRYAELQARALALAERFGLATEVRWFRSAKVETGYWSGRWDEALTLVDELIADAEQGALRYLEAPWRTMRGRMRLARGDLAGALDDSEKAVDLAQLAKDPQILAPTLLFRAHVLIAGDDVKAAGELVRQHAVVQPAEQMLISTAQSVDLPVVVVATGRTDEFMNAVGRVRFPGPWIDAAVAFVDGELNRAAEIYAKIGTRPDEAYARLRAAEQLVVEGRRAEADEHLQKALTFYRSVGATRYIQEGEALFAAAS